MECIETSTEPEGGLGWHLSALDLDWPIQVTGIVTVLDIDRSLIRVNDKVICTWHPLHKVKFQSVWKAKRVIIFAP